MIMTGVGVAVTITEKETRARRTGTHGTGKRHAKREPIEQEAATEGKKQFKMNAQAKPPMTASLLDARPASLLLPYDERPGRAAGSRS